MKYGIIKIFKELKMDKSKQKKEIKKEYSAPKLTELGFMAKLTQGGGGSFTDGGGMPHMA